MYLSESFFLEFEEPAPLSDYHVLSYDVGRVNNLRYVRKSQNLCHLEGDEEVRDKKYEAT